MRLATPGASNPVALMAIGVVTLASVADRIRRPSGSAASSRRRDAIIP
jgi:hypothetical protein